MKIKHRKFSFVESEEDYRKLASSAYKEKTNEELKKRGGRQGKGSRSPLGSCRISRLGTFQEQEICLVPIVHHEEYHRLNTRVPGT